MRVVEFIKGEFAGWEKYEKIIFPVVILLIIVLSLYMKDSKVALVSAICGISYTMLAGKGKISCYFFGICATVCYIYLACKNSLYGNMFLYLFYYFPMYIVGIFKWKKHLNKKSNAIVKTSLNKKEFFIYFVSAVLLSAALACILPQSSTNVVLLDAFTTVFSILGMLLTVKRTIEQWYAWSIVNGLSVIMWINACINGSNSFAMILMWSVYFILGLYFLYVWKKDLKNPGDV